LEAGDLDEDKRVAAAQIEVDEMMMQNCAD